jgi:hypothetical protein
MDQDRQQGRAQAVEEKGIEERHKIRG